MSLGLKLWLETITIFLGVLVVSVGVLIGMVYRLWVMLCDMKDDLHVDSIVEYRVPFELDDEKRAAIKKQMTDWLSLWPKAPPRKDVH